MTDTRERRETHLNAQLFRANMFTEEISEILKGKSVVHGTKTLTFHSHSYESVCHDESVLTVNY